jgi:Kef-type K+ transport system membrane component KefB
VFGALFLIGLALEAIGRKVHVPRVTLMILLGVVAGPSILDLLPIGIVAANDVVAPTALTMVAFLLGGTLERDALSAHGREILTVSLVVVAAAVAAVAGGLVLWGAPVALALLLGGIAAATDPAAVQDIVREARARGPFVERLLGIVAIDDAWGLIAFSLVLTFASALLGADEAGAAILAGLWESGGAVVVGLAVGAPAAFLTGRVSPGEPTLIEALGIILLVAGLSISLEVSYLLAGMVCGATIANLASHHDRPFHEIERIEWPFLLLFFVLAGASFDAGALADAGLLCVAFIAIRASSRVVGGWIGGRLAGLPTRTSAFTGLALMPQAGVAIGMALAAAETLPHLAAPLLSVTVASTIVFELAGPFLTQWAMFSETSAGREGAGASGR